MKNVSVLFILGIFLFSSQEVNSSHKISSVYVSGDTVDCFQQDQYAITGRTRNQYGENYSISLRVTGTVTSFYKSISYVEYNDGYSWVRIQHQPVYGQGGVYYITVKYNQFYFEF